MMLFLLKSTTTSTRYIKTKNEKYGKIEYEKKQAVNPGQRLQKKKKLKKKCGRKL